MLIYRVYSEVASRVRNNIIYILDNYIWDDKQLAEQILGSDEIKKTLDIFTEESTAIEEVVKLNISNSLELLIKKA